LGAAFLAVAACWNWRYTTVPNWLLALFLLSFFPAAWLSGMSFDEVTQRCAVFGATFLVILLLFALRVIGGGAGKLVAVTTLWLPLPIVPWFGIVWVVLAGALYLTMRYSGGRWIEVIGEKFASIVGIVGIVLLALAA
jgi:Flp pilus assembly protein protease CpaA